MRSIVIGAVAGQGVRSPLMAIETLLKVVLLTALVLNAGVLFWSLSGRGKVARVDANRQRLATRLFSVAILLLLAGTVIELLITDRPSTSALLLATMALNGWAQERQHRRTGIPASGL